MSSPIVEQIAVDLAETLEGITAAAGYAVTVSEVIRPRRTGVEASPANYGIILLQGDEDAVDGAAVTNPPARQWRQLFQMDLYLRISDASDTPIDTLCNLFACEVERAVLADPTRGGLAIDTQRMARLFREPSDTYDGPTLIWAVTYRVRENDPRVQV